MDKMIKVRDFTLFPGPRYRRLGEASGEAFREEVLLPKLQMSSDWIIDLDGVAGYGSSFLEEAFGGSIRARVPVETMRKIVANIKSNEDPDLIDEIKSYIEEAAAMQGN